MPFTHRLTFSAANGHQAALRALLEEQTRARKAKGYRCALGWIIYGTDSAQFDIFAVFEDLNALEGFRNDPPSPAYIAQVAALTARPPHVELLRGIVPPPAGGPSPAYTTRTVFFPVTGKIVPLRDALEQNAREEQAEGRRVTLSIGYAGPPRLEVSRLYQSFAELDRSGQSLNEVRGKRIEGLFAAPPVTLIRQVLVPID